MQLKKATGEKSAFGGPCNLLDWLRAARLYNGDTTSPNSITYNHSIKVACLYEKLCGSQITSTEHDYLQRFIEWVKQGAQYPFND